VNDRPDTDPVAVVDEVLPGYETSLARKVLGEVRWSFTRPWHWLSGVAVNLLLSVLYLVVVPPSGQPHRDWAILVGSYFAVFILADVTTTNVLGADAVRVRVSLLRGISLLRILVVKNLALLIIVGLPTLVATGIITVNSEADYRLVLTLPGVAFPILTWLGVGNIVSVALPVAPVPWRERWEERHNLRRTGRWAFHLALPYLLLVAVDPIGALPRTLNRLVPVADRTIGERGAVLWIVGLLLYALGTGAAVLLARLRGVRI
jgi:hypothetical protein